MQGRVDTPTADLLARCLMILARRGEQILAAQEKATSAGTLGSNTADVAKRNGGTLLPKDITDANQV